LMTALAMVIGMVPMALGLGEGGEQNAPLGRAVIGGLLLATVATLFFVPVVFSMIRHKMRHRKFQGERRFFRQKNSTRAQCAGFIRHFWGASGAVCHRLRSALAGE